MARRSIWWILIIVLSLPISYAATIRGTVYDYDFYPAKDAIIRINSTPAQTFVAKNGSFVFELLQGVYRLDATYSSEGRGYLAQQDIKVVSGGIYFIDMLLIPEFSDEGLGEPDIDVDDLPLPIEKKNSPVFVAALILIIAFFLMMGINAVVFRRKPVENDDLSLQVIEYLRKQGGRTKQKDIRKEFPMSEAKISLVVTELAQKGKIEKIKIGRGNIIILK